MPMSLDWYDEAQRVVLFRVEGRWSFADLRALAAQFDALAAEVGGTVDAIGDFQRAGMPGGDFVATLRDVRRRPRPYLGAVVLVGMGGFIEGILTAARAVMPAAVEGVRTAASLEAAYRMIMDLRAQRMKETR